MALRATRIAANKRLVASLIGAGIIGPGGGTAIPAAALTLGGQAITLNSQFITKGA